MDPKAPMIVAKAEASGEFGAGAPVTVTLHLTDMASGKAMDADSLVIAHTQKVHVLAVDPSLTDYSHSHPVAGAKAGDWSFQFKPKFNRPYRLWLDLTPVAGAQQYVMVTVNETGALAPVDRTASLTAAVADIGATLSFDAPLVAGQAAMGHLQILRGGKPFAALEPVMGAYSHIVAISEDWSSIAHVHPLGAEPGNAGDRGGPAIDFHLQPGRAGFLKLFAQIQVDGRDLYLPFATTVAPATTALAPTSAMPVYVQNIAPAAIDAVKVVDAFAAAIKAVKLDVAATLLDPKVLILESGGSERSRDEYMGEHAIGDAAFLQNANIQLRYRQAQSEGNFAWVATESTIGSMNEGKAVALLSTETMLLKRTGRDWRIVHIHWSSRPVPKG